MKKLLFGLFIMVFSLAAVAQKKHPGDHMRGRPGMMNKKGKMMHKMGEKLNLTDAQKEKMKSLNENFRKEMKALHEKENITVKEQRDQKYALAQKHKKNMEAILTPEQKKQMEEMKVKMKDKKAEKMDNKLDKMKEKIGLSDDQAKKIKTMNESFSSQMVALKDNDKLSRTDKQAQMKKLKEDHKAKMDAVFTKEQKAKIEEMKKSKKGRKEHNKDHDGKW